MSCIFRPIVSSDAGREQAALSINDATFNGNIGASIHISACSTNARSVISTCYGRQTARIAPNGERRMSITCHSARLDSTHIHFVRGQRVRRAIFQNDGGAAQASDSGVFGAVDGHAGEPHRGVVGNEHLMVAFERAHHHVAVQQGDVAGHFREVHHAVLTAGVRAVVRLFHGRYNVVVAVVVLAARGGGEADAANQGCGHRPLENLFHIHKRLMDNSSLIAFFFIGAQASKLGACLLYFS